jgi:hypothetical protein
MAKGSEVLSMLLPDGGWILSGEKFEDIEFIYDRAKCTKAQFEAGFAAYDAWKSEQDAAKAADKEALLDRLGITADEAKLLLS